MPVAPVGNQYAAGRGSNPITALDSLVKRAVGALLRGRPASKHKDAIPVTSNMLNAVTNAIRLRLDIYQTYGVSERLETQKAEIEEMMMQVQQALKQRGE